MELVTPQNFSLPTQLREPQSAYIILAKLARDDCTASHNLLQESINHLSQKAKDNQPFDEYEKNFLRVLFTCPWWGGKEHGMNEVLVHQNILGSEQDSIQLSPVSDHIQLSLAKMAQHYVGGEGQRFPLELAAYKNSSIVKDAVKALRVYICELYTFKKPVTVVSTTDAGFLHSKHAEQIEKTRRASETKGFIFNDGTLMLDQRDARLINLGNRFKITGMTSAMETRLMTRWRIEGTYQFENFSQGEAETALPISDQLPLVIPSCLGVHMVALGIAQPFNYFADWVEHYPLVKL